MLDLEKVTITKGPEPDEVTILHLPTGTSVRVPAAKLERWAIAQVREAVK